MGYLMNMEVENVGFNSLDLAKYIYTIYICINCYSGWLCLVISALNPLHQWSSSSIPHPNLTS